jgi:hypothetical protein
VKTSAKTLREVAERRVSQYIRDHLDERFEGHTEDIVDLVLEVFTKPDHEMMQAGVYELGLALPVQARPAYRRQLVTTMWKSMMDRAG